MRLFLSSLVLMSMVLAGCSGLRESRINPANWFGKSQSTTIARAPGSGEPQPVNPLIGKPTNTQLVAANQYRSRKGGLFSRRNRVEPYEGTLVDQITELYIEPTTTGAIVRATGVTVRQGAFDVRLIEENGGEPVNGVLTYTLKAYQPVNYPQGSDYSRQVKVGDFIAFKDLDGISEIKVIGARNVRTARRR